MATGKMADLNSMLESMAEQGSAVITKIQRACVLVTLQVHRWHGTDSADEAEIKIGDVDVAARVSIPKWRLIPKKWDEIFKNIEHRARALLGWYSVRSPIRGSRFVPINKAEELFEKLNNVKIEMSDNANKFCTQAEYDLMINDIKQEVGAAADTVLSHLPNLKTIRAKFGMDWFVVPIGEPGDALTDDALMYVKQARETLNSVVLKSVEAMIKEPRQKLYDAVAGLVELVSKEKRRIKTGSLEIVKTAFYEFRNWAFLSDDQTLEALKQVESALSATEIKRLNADQSVAKELSNALVALQKQVADDTAVLDGFNKFKRAVEL